MYRLAMSPTLVLGALYVMASTRHSDRYLNRYRGAVLEAVQDWPPTNETWFASANGSKPGDGLAAAGMYWTGLNDGLTHTTNDR